MSIGYSIGQPVKAPGNFDVDAELAVHDDASIDGSLECAGDFTVSSGKFAVDAATGDTAIAGDLAIASKLWVDAQTGSVQMGDGYTLNPDFTVLEEGGSTLLKVDAANKQVNVHTPGTAPASQSLEYSQVTFYLDEASNMLMVKVKYSGGTVKTGGIQLA